MKMFWFDLKQFVKWKIVYNPIWKFEYKGYYTWLWDIPDILHKMRWGQPGDNGLPITHNCKRGWRGMSFREKEIRREMILSVIEIFI